MHGRTRVGAVARGAVAPLAVLVSLGAVGAGSASAAESPVTALHHAAEKVLAQNSAHIVVTETIGVDGTSVQILRVVGTQTFAKPVQGSLRTTVISGTTGQTTSIPELMDGTSIYLQEKGTWYVLTGQQALAEQGLSGSFQTSGNPAQALALLYQSGAKVTVAGHRQVDGVTMTEYHSSVNFTKGFKTPTGLSFTAKGLATYKKLTGGKPLGVDAFIDKAGVLRREEVHIPLSANALATLGLTGEPGKIAMLVTCDFSTFGVAVTITDTVPATAKPLPSAGGASQS